ncbi:MAG: HlyD family secretion protein, partial [Anaerolineae bacterium]
IRPGEPATPGAPLISLADLAEWQIETSDLTETYVARVAEGAAVSISLDALPDLQMTGKVVRIRPLGENRQGDIVYTVVIRPDQSDSRLRWNMTASVIIEPQ